LIRCPLLSNAIVRCIARVDLPLPPFWLPSKMTCGPDCEANIDWIPIGVFFFSKQQIGPQTNAEKFAGAHLRTELNVDI
jgi:hypothetical protein